MADIKISQLTAKGTAIASTDLIEISESDGAGGYVTKSVTGANILSTKQDTLISGTNIKTINSTTILGSGDLTVQPTLVSGTNIKTIEGQSILGSGNINITNSDVGLGNVDNTSDLNKPISTATQDALNTKQNTIANSDSITQGSTNLFLTTAERTKLTNTSGTNTGDQTNISGNAATVTTNANLTGVVTSTGNATTIANGAISNAMLANGAVANLSGTNTGDNATNSQYSGLVSNATHTGDAEGNFALTVKGINNTILSNLNTGILKNTTGTGVPSIAVAADFPILNQNTTGTAGSTATLATARTISTNGDVLYTSPPFDGSANVLGTATLASIGVAGTYTKVTTDAKGRVTVGANITAGDVPTLNQNTTGTAANVTGIVALANGGTGTATPSLVAGTNVTITGSFPNQTINASGGGGGGTVTSVSGTAPIVSSGGTAPAISITAATTSVAGSMSSTDKTKLDGIQAGAQVNVSTNLSKSTSATDVSLNSSTGSGVSIGTVTTSVAGVMTATDKTKLDGIANGATNVTNTNQLTNGAGFITSAGTATNVSGVVAIANGGTGTATPSLVAGTNISITGTFPNQTITAAGGGGGGVTQIVAGTNVTISPAGGTGVVTVNASGGGGGTAGGPHLITQYQENYTYGLKTNSAANTTCTTATNRMTLMPFVPNTDFLRSVIDTLVFILNVTIGFNVNCKIVIFSDSYGRPLTKLYEGPSMSCTTTGQKFDFSSFGGFTKGTKYWIGTITSGAGPTLTQYSANSMIPISENPTGATNWFLSTTSYAYASVPATVNGYLFTHEATNCPAVFLSMIGGE